MNRECWWGSTLMHGCVWPLICTTENAESAAWSTEEVCTYFFGCRKWRRKFVISELVIDQRKREFGRSSTSYWKEWMLVLTQSLVCRLTCWIMWRLTQIIKNLMQTRSQPTQTLPPLTLHVNQKSLQFLFFNIITKYWLKSFCPSYTWYALMMAPNPTHKYSQIRIKSTLYKHTKSRLHISHCRLTRCFSSHHQRDNSVQKLMKQSSLWGKNGAATWWWLQRLLQSSSRTTGWLTAAQRLSESSADFTCGLLCLL